MSLIHVYLIGLAAVLAMMAVIWVVSLLIRNTSIVDIFWGFGFVMLAGVYALLADGFVGRRVLLLVIVALWGLRLTAYIFWRNHGKGEDFRYAAWRQQHGARWWWYSFFQTFMLQGLLMWLISSPLLLALGSPVPARITPLDVAGLLLWLLGFAFEAGGDWQLARFKANPANRGRVLDTGFWRYTRHPNYFGDAAQWWGFFLLAAGVPWGFLTVYSPILMTFLLLRVSGVLLLEKSLVETKPQYRDYIARTSAFFPLPPRSDRSDQDG